MNEKKISAQKIIIEILFILLFVCQLAVIAYFNVKCIGSHMGFDDSWSFLKAALMWKEKTINSVYWKDTTSTALDSPVTLAALIYGLTGDLLPSYGIANMIVLSLLLLCMWDILAKNGISRMVRFIALNMVVCPYMLNGFTPSLDLGYFSDILGGHACYSVRILIILLIVREFIVTRTKGKIDIPGYISLVLCVIAGMSSGVFILMMILLPYILYMTWQMFIENNYRVLLKIEAVYAYLGTICIFIGKFLCKQFFTIQTHDDTRAWTPVTRLFSNYQAPIGGFMKLLGVLPVENGGMKIMTREGVMRLFPIIILVVLVMALISAVRRTVRDPYESNGFLFFLLNTIAVNYIMFGLFNAQYGEIIFEERYLISTFMMMIILTACFLQHLDDKLIFKRAVVVALLFCLMLYDRKSDKIYINTTNDEYQLEEMRDIIAEHDAGFVCFFGDDIRNQERCMRVLDLDRISRNTSGDGTYHDWGDYLYCQDNSDYQGSTIIAVPNDSDIVPWYILDQYTLLERLDQISLYISDHNPIDQTPGITGDISIDFPYTPGISVQSGDFDGTGFVTDGTEGYVLGGPNCQTVDGVYDFELDYEILEGDGAAFELSLDWGANKIGSTDLSASKQKGLIQGVVLEEGHALEYHVWCPQGVIIRINKITITRTK